MGEAKIKLKTGSIKLEFEGEAEFLNEGLKELLETMVNLSERDPKATVIQTTDDISSNSSPSPNNTADFSTATLASHLDVKTGSDLAICALARLQICQGKQSASRKKISDEMKTATAYYNKNMSKNLSTSIQTLLSNKRINEVGAYNYALSSTERNGIEEIVKNIG